MSQYEEPTQEEVQGAREAEAPAAEPTEGAPALLVDPDAPPIPAALREVDPAKLAEVRRKLAEHMARMGKTASGSEDPDSAPQTGGVEGDKPVGQTITGADVDWSEYDLDFSVKHLYPKALYRETPQGPKWVAMLDEFYSTERAAKQHGKQVNAPGATDKEDTEPLNLGEYLTQMVNGSDGWRIAAVMPGTSGNAIVLLQKQTPVVLPDPVRLKKEEEVEAPKDPELQEIEDAAIEFASEEGLTPPDAEPAIEQEEEQVINLIPVAREDVEVDETGALPARETNLVREAIERNRGLTVPAPVPSGIQPPPTEDGEAAGIENIRAGMRNILEGPDFDLGEKG